MSKLLILGASILQLPAILQAKELGHHVTVADYDPEAVGVKYADEYFNVSTIDINAICDIANRIKPDGIMTLATDMPLRSVAAATSLLDLPGIAIETAVKATDKGEMIKVFKDHNVESPWYFIIEHPSELQGLMKSLTFPCIIKPVDNAGSRGVMMVNDLHKLKEAYLYSRKQSREGRVIFEEYLSGKEVSVEIIISEGIINILAVTDKITTGAPHFVEMGHSQQSQLNTADVEKIKDLARRSVTAIGIKTGAAHVEIMLTDKGPRMIELGARMGGACITSHLVPLSTGINMVKAAIEVAMGQKPNVEPKFNKGSAIRYFNVSAGIITSIEGIEEARRIKGLKECIILKNIGDEVKNIESSLDRVGYAISQGENAEDALDICEQALKKITIRTVK